MTRLARMLHACTAVVLAGVMMPVARRRHAGAGRPSAAARRDAVVALGRLHHVAQREIALGLMAQVAAVHPETMGFATDLETDFRVLDRHILAIADAHGIGEDRLRQAYADENTLALDGQTADLRSALHGPRRGLRSPVLGDGGSGSARRFSAARRRGRNRSQPRPSLPRQRACSVDSSAGRPQRKPARARYPRADLTPSASGR